MKQLLDELISSAWRERAGQLEAAVSEALRLLEPLLVQAQNHAEASSSEAQLNRSMGGFATDSVDLQALSSALQQGRGEDASAVARLARLRDLHGDLLSAQQRLTATPPLPGYGDGGASPDTLIAAFDSHIEACAAMLGKVRMVQLESRGRYDPAEHDAYFERFDWRQLDNAEMAMCPPFVVYCDMSEPVGEQLACLVELTSSGRPFKQLVLHQAWQPGGEETGRAAAYHGLNDLSLLFLGLRSAYFVQTSSVAATPLATQVARALESPRAAVISLFADRAEEADFERRARAALESRAFPHFVYDPEAASDFLSCLDISDNPQPESAWVEADLDYRDEEGKPAQLRQAQSFADYALGESEFASQFTPFSDHGKARPVPIAKYLELEPEQRRQHRPYVCCVDEDQRLLRRSPSAAIVAYSIDRWHLWNTLQELAGIENPLVRRAESRLREQLESERERALAEQKTRLEAAFAAERERLVAATVAQLASQLIGKS